MNRPNILLIGVDSLRADHMSCYGYQCATTPNIDALAAGGVRFTHSFSPHIPTTSGYANMLTGLDCFGTSMVALRHEGGYPEGVTTLPEILRPHGYESTCVGFGGDADPSRNPAPRGFDHYLDYIAWGGWDERPLRKAENLNVVAIPELNRLAASGKPFLLFLRHMDPHSPYLPPAPFDRMFYSGNEFDPDNRSLVQMKEFKPFRDYLLSWMPPGITDAEYVVAQYDGELAYMDAQIQLLLDQLSGLGIEENTLVILNSDHGETLTEHECWFDHHGMYDCTLHVPLIMSWPGVLRQGTTISRSITLQQDLVPTIMGLLDHEPGIAFDGRSQIPHYRGEVGSDYDGFYITEATWMRKHGWRTARWKLIHALEPDFHFKPEVELYALGNDPGENHNLAKARPDIVAEVEALMQQHIAKRERETGRTNPMFTCSNWHGSPGGHQGPFGSSQQAYDLIHIGDPAAARRLQAHEDK